MNAKEYLNRVRFADRLISVKDKERCKMAKYVSVRELKRKIRENVYSIENDYGFPDDGMSDVDIYKIIDGCKQYEFEEPRTAEWIKVANNIEMEQVTRVGLRLKCSKCGNVVFATKNKGGYEIDNYCSHCGARMDKE